MKLLDADRYSVPKIARMLMTHVRNLLFCPMSYPHDCRFPAMARRFFCHVALHRLLGFLSAMLGGSAARSDFFRAHAPCAFHGCPGFGLRM